MDNDGYNVVGIDLGTTNSCVAVWKNEQIAIVSNEMGKRTTPSVVSFLPTETIIGNAAERKRTVNYANTIFDCKRLIGHKVSDIDVQQDIKLWPFRVLADTNDDPIITIENSSNGKKSFTPEDISAMILNYLKVQAESFTGRSIKDAVITVPAYFNEFQRKATEKAARMAGLNILRLLDEPSAAAFAYNFEQNDETKHILIYDLGGGTFDVSLLKVGCEQVSVISSDGDNHLGGEDFDRNLMDFLFDEYRKRMGVDISQDRLWRARMRNAVESCKIELSVTMSSLIEFENSDFTYPVSRFLFENINKELFDRTVQVVEKTIEKAGISKDMVDEIVLVGGSTRIPRIQQLLIDHFPTSNMCKSVNADEAVATGAVIMASVVMSQRLRALPQNAVLSVGVGTHGGIVEVMIPRGTLLPASCTYDFITPTDYQRAAEFDIVLGERPLLKGNSILGKISLNDLPLSRSDEVVITITMKLSIDYMLSVTAVESKTLRQSSWQLCIGENTTGSPLNLNSEQIQKIIDVANENRSRDEELVACHKAMNSLYCVVEDGYSLLHNPDSRMTEEWIEQNKGLLAGIKEWMKQNEDADVRECKEREQLVRKNLLSYSKIYNSCYNKQFDTICVLSIILL